MDSRDKLHFVSLNRSTMQSEPRPLTQLLIKRRFFQVGQPTNTSQKKIEVITNANFVIRKHMPVANPFKDFPISSTQVLSYTLAAPLSPQKNIRIRCRPRKTPLIKSRISLHGTSKKVIDKSKTLKDEMISGWD